MGVEKVGWLLELVNKFLASTAGIGTYLFIAGLTILFVIGFALSIAFLIKVIKEIPNMTVSQFIKTLIVLGIVFVIVGAFI